MKNLSALVGTKVTIKKSFPCKEIAGKTLTLKLDPTNYKYWDSKGKRVSVIMFPFLHYGKYYNVASKFIKL
jgi:hypothetical protein